jgi:hypothetical protein
MPDDSLPELSAPPTKLRVAVIVFLILLLIITYVAAHLVLGPLAALRFTRKFTRILVVAYLIYNYPRHASIGALLGAALSLLWLAGTSSRPDSLWRWYDPLDRVLFAGLTGACLGAFVAWHTKSRGNAAGPDPPP